VTVFWSEAVKVLDLEILIIKLFTSILDHNVAVSDTQTQLHSRPTHRLELGELYTNTLYEYNHVFTILEIITVESMKIQIFWDITPY
jgi:hypothetical protein